VKKDDQILIIFCTNIPDTTGHQKTVSSHPSNVCFALPARNRTSEIGIEMSEQKVKKSQKLLIVT